MYTILVPKKKVYFKRHIRLFNGQLKYLVCFWPGIRYHFLMNKASQLFCFRDGKWCIFANQNAIDEVWAKICRAIHDGKFPTCCSGNCSLCPSVYQCIYMSVSVFVSFVCFCVRNYSVLQFFMSVFLSVYLSVVCLSVCLSVFYLSLSPQVCLFISHLPANRIFYSGALTFSVSLSACLSLRFSCEIVFLFYLPYYYSTYF